MRVPERHSTCLCRFAPGEGESPGLRDVGRGIEAAVDTRCLGRAAATLAAARVVPRAAARAIARRVPRGDLHHVAPGPFCPVAELRGQRSPGLSHDRAVEPRLRGDGLRVRLLGRAAGAPRHGADAQLLDRHRADATHRGGRDAVAGMAAAHRLPATRAEQALSHAPGRALARLRQAPGLILNRRPVRRPASRRKPAPGGPSRPMRSVDGVHPTAGRASGAAWTR